MSMYRKFLYIIGKIWAVFQGSRNKTPIFGFVSRTIFNPTKLVMDANKVRCAQLVKLPY